eukprot:4369738-Amphidinium_carterae.1
MSQLHSYSDCWGFGTHPPGSDWGKWNSWMCRTSAYYPQRFLLSTSRGVMELWAIGYKRLVLYFRSVFRYEVVDNHVALLFFKSPKST